MNKPSIDECIAHMSDVAYNAPKPFKARRYEILRILRAVKEARELNKRGHDGKCDGCER